MCSSQINRLHKRLDDAGIKRGAVVSDIHGVSARAMVRGLIEGQSEAVLLSHARIALKHKTAELAVSLDNDLSKRHLFVLRHLSHSIDALPRQWADIGRLPDARHAALRLGSPTAADDSRHQ